MRSSNLQIFGICCTHNDKYTESYHPTTFLPSVITLKLLRGTFILVDSGAPCGKSLYEHHYLDDYNKNNYNKCIEICLTMVSFTYVGHM